MFYFLELINEIMISGIIGIFSQKTVNHFKLSDKLIIFFELRMTIYYFKVKTHRLND